MERERILSEQREIHDFLEKEADHAFQGRIRSSDKIISGTSWIGQKRRENAKCWYCSLWNWHAAPIPEDGTLSGKSIDRSDSKGKELAMWRIRNEKQSFSGWSHWRSTKNLLCRYWQSSTIETWWVLYAKGREPLYRESAYGSDSGIAGQGEINSLNDAKEFSDPETASSSGLSHVPSQPMSIPSPRRMVSRDSCCQPDTRNSWSITGHVLEGLRARGEPSSAFFENSKNLASSSCRLKPIDTGKIAEG